MCFYIMSIQNVFFIPVLRAAIPIYTKKYIIRNLTIIINRNNQGVVRASGIPMFGCCMRNMLNGTNHREPRYLIQLHDLRDLRLIMCVRRKALNWESSVNIPHVRITVFIIVLLQWSVATYYTQHHQRAQINLCITRISVTRIVVHINIIQLLLYTSTLLGYLKQDTRIPSYMYMFCKAKSIIQSEDTVILDSIHVRVAQIKSYQ